MIKVLNNPLINHKITIIRDKKTKMHEFRELVNEIGSLMVYEITSGLKTKEVEVETPLCVTTKEVLAKDIVIVPILRAGIGMVEGIEKMIPTAKIGHLGMYRNEETLEPVEYLVRLPKNLDEKTVILVDPMLATGGSASMAVDVLKRHGANEIIFVGLVGVDEGINKLNSLHPDVSIYLATKDDFLNEKGYIVPGLGDCGDRLFGTLD